MISPVCSIDGVLGDDDLQVGPAVGAEQRGEPRQPLARDPQHPVQAAPGAAARPQTVTSTPSIVAPSERSRPAANE